MCEDQNLYLVILEDGTQKGPASVSVLKEWAAQGAVLPTTLLKNVSTGETCPAASLVGVVATQAVQAPPPLKSPASDNLPPVGAYPRASHEKQAENYGALDMLVPIRADIFAVAAGYFGLFSLVVVGAPFAIIFGVIALRRIKHHPERTGKGRAWFGIIMGSLVLSLTILAIAGSIFGGR